MKTKCCKDKKSVANLSQTIKFLKVISEENRLKILCILRDEERCVCDIWQCLNLAQNLTSHHLRVLKDFGLVLSRQEGLKVFYRLNKEVVKKHIKILNKIINSTEIKNYKGENYEQHKRIHSTRVGI